MRTLARAEDLEELRARVGSVRPDSARRWGRMSAHQMLCHVGDALRVAVGDVEVKPFGGGLRGALMKWGALYVPLRWPHGLPTSVELDQDKGGGTRPGDFAVDRQQAAALLEAVATSPRLDHQRHPLFGRMSRADWLRWAWLHTDHHLRQFGV